MNRHSEIATSVDMLSGFPKQLRAGLKRCDFEAGRLLVGVSGGADSVALLRGLAGLCDEETDAVASGLRFEIIVAHIDHQIRDDSSDDAVWVSLLADRLGLRSRIESVDVLERVAKTGESVEEAARKVRYESLVRIAETEGCSAIAVAHTADDQAETVLHHLIRGTSVKGLRGMQWTRPAGDESSAQGIQLIRPMLDIRRGELEEWLLEIGQEFCTDPTNANDDLTRNRIRHELLPLLEQEFNPQVRKALGTLAGHASEVSDLLSDLTQQLVEDSLVQSSECAIRISCPALAEQLPILIRETLLTIWRQAGWPLKRMGHREWQKLSELVSQVNEAAVSLPERIEARRRGQLLVLSRPQVAKER